MLETYTLPKNYIELEKDQKNKDHYNYHKERVSNWIVHKGPATVLEVIAR